MKLITGDNSIISCLIPQVSHSCTSMELAFSSVKLENSVLKNLNLTISEPMLFDEVFEIQ